MNTLESIIATYLNNGALDVHIGATVRNDDIVVYAGPDDPVIKGNYINGAFVFKDQPLVPKPIEDDEYEASGWSREYSAIGGRKSRNVESLRQRLLDDGSDLARALASEDIIAKYHILITNDHGITSSRQRTQKIIDTVNDLPLTDVQKAGIILNLNRWMNVPSGGFEDNTPTPSVDKVSFARLQLTWRGQKVDVPANWGGWAQTGGSLRPGMSALQPVPEKKLRPTNDTEYTLAYADVVDSSGKVTVKAELTDHCVFQPNVPGNADTWVASYYEKFATAVLGYAV
jgi:hypothetical protein